MRAEVVLPVPRGPGEQVRLALPPLGHCVRKRLDHVILALDLAETSGPVAAVQRLGGHRGHDTQRM